MKTIPNRGTYQRRLRHDIAAMALAARVGATWCSVAAGMRDVKRMDGDSDLNMGQLSANCVMRQHDKAC